MTEIRQCESASDNLVNTIFLSPLNLDLPALNLEDLLRLIGGRWISKDMVNYALAKLAQLSEGKLAVLHCFQVVDQESGAEFRARSDNFRVCLNIS